MALFKQMRGKRANLDTQEKHDGYAYFCIDDGTFHIDYADADGNLQRKQIIASKSATITLPVSSWVGDTEPYSQAVTLSDVTVNSKIDIQPNIIQLSDLLANGIALQAINEDGVVTVYAIGGKPTIDYDIQVFITETEVV